MLRVLDPDPYCQCGSGSRRVKADPDAETGIAMVWSNVPDPDPPDPHVLDFPDPDSLVRGMDPRIRIHSKIS
jgi:hypothetical protein